MGIHPSLQRESYLGILDQERWHPGPEAMNGIRRKLPAFINGENVITSRGCLQTGTWTRLPERRF